MRRARRGPRQHASSHVPGAAGLAWRQARADPAVTLLLALVVAVAAALATLAPRVISDTNARQVEHTVSALSVVQRDLSSSIALPFAFFGETDGGSGQFAPPDQTWRPLNDGMQRVRAAQPEPLRSLMQPGRFFIDVDPQRQAPNDPDSDIARVELQYRVDPQLRDLVRLVDGTWPAPTVPIPERFDSLPASPGTDPVSHLDILLSADAAEQLRWEIGEVRDVAAAAPTRLSGTYVPIDPDDPHWQHSTYGAELAVFDDFNLGKLATAAAYLAPANPGVVQPGSTRRLQVWFPLQADDLGGDDVGTLTAQLGALTAAQVTLVGEQERAQALREALPPNFGAEVDIEARFTTEIFDTMRGLAAQQRATSSIVAVVAAGPVGITIAVLALGAGLSVTRRQATLAVASARGGSSWQVRGVLAAEGALCGLPAAALGYAVAGLLAPPAQPWPWGALVMAGCIGLVPSAVLALMGSAPRPGRSDLGPTAGRHRVRWVAEVAVIALAAVPVWRLLDRGFAGGPDDTGVDLLMAATPALLVLAAAVVTMRVYPVPLRVLLRALQTRSDLAPFLGVARSLRDPSGGLLPALVIILALAVVATSAVLAPTISEGSERAVWAENGAQVRISGPRVTDDMVDRLSEVPGVGQVARVAASPRTVVVAGAESNRSVTVYVVDDSLAEVQAAAPLVRPLPPALYAGGAPLPVVTGGALTAGEGELTIAGRGPVRVVDHIVELPGVSTDQSFLVVSRSAWQAAGGAVSVGTLALLSVEPDSAVSSTADRVAQAIPFSRVETPQARIEALQSVPVTAGLLALFGFAVPLTVGLSVLAILLAHAIGSPSRMRLLAILRTLGTSSRHSRALTTWELAPLLAVAAVVGCVLGAAIPWLLLRAVDLRGLTGGTLPPALALDWGVIALVAGGLLITAVTSIVVSAAVAARSDLARHLRVGDGR